MSWMEIEMTRIIKSARTGNAVFAAAVLLLSFAAARAVEAADTARGHTSDLQVSAESSVDPVSVGSVAPGTHAFARPTLTAGDVDSSSCGPGQLVLDFTTGTLFCDWGNAD
jgi:hypothetical protein